MLIENVFEIIHLSDVVIEISTETVENNIITRERRTSDNKLGYNKFPIGFFKYEQLGRATNWVTIFKPPFGTTRDDSRFVRTLTTASNMVPKYLSCRETSGNIASICLATGRD